MVPKMVSKRLRYPQKVDETITSVISFSPVRIAAPALLLNGKSVSASTLSENADAVAENVDFIQNAVEQNQQGFGREQLAARGVDVGVAAARRRATTQLLAMRETDPSLRNGKAEFTGDTVKLHVPIGFTVADGINYGTPELGRRGIAATNVARQSGDIMSLVDEAVTGGTKEAIEALSAFADRTKGSNVAEYVAATFMNGKKDGIQAAASNFARISVNPNVRTVFNDVSVRSFSFSFNFTPVSAEESLEVKKIIKLFREHMYPEALGLRNIVYAYKFPELFKIRIMSKVGDEGIYKDVGTPMQLSYLTNFSASYNPTSTAMHPDGSPTEISIQMTFVEYRPLNRNLVQREGTESFYDFENLSIEGEPTEDL